MLSAGFTKPPSPPPLPRPPKTLPQTWPNQNKREEVERIKTAVLEQLQQLRGAPGQTPSLLCPSCVWPAAPCVPPKQRLPEHRLSDACVPPAAAPAAAAAGFAMAERPPDALLPEFNVDVEEEVGGWVVGRGGGGEGHAGGCVCVWCVVG